MLIEGIKDTLSTANTTAHSSSGGGWILHHIMDSNQLELPFLSINLPHLELFGLDISITRFVVFMWFLAAILIIVLLLTSKKYKKTLVPRGFVNVIEITIIFVRDEIVRATIRGEDQDRFLPYLLTTFFFILLANFFGLIPFSATVTGNIAVTATLAIISFFMTQVAGIRNYGFFGYFKAMIPHGMPVAILPLIIVVEILALFTKPFALCIRLFANMIAGHVVIFSLLGLIFIIGIFVAPISVAFALFIYLLELLVALIQAYIFTMLSSLFIGMAAYQEH